MKEEIDHDSVKEHNKFLKDEKEKDKTAKKNEEIRPKSRSPIIS